MLIFSLEKLPRDDDKDAAAAAKAAPKAGAKLRKAPSLRALFSKKESSGSYEIR